MENVNKTLMLRIVCIMIQLIGLVLQIYTRNNWWLIFSVGFMFVGIFLPKLWRREDEQ